MTFNPFPPPQAEMGSGRLAVLLAVVAEHHEHGRATVRSVAERAGLASTSTAWSHLDRLRRDGWVAWEDGRSGTLRPLVRPVPFGAPGRGVGSGAVRGDETQRRSALKADAAEARHTTKAAS